MLKSLNQLEPLRRFILRARIYYYNRIWGMDLDPTCQFSLSAKFDKTYPAGIHVGPYSYITFRTSILTHDMVRGLYLDTRIGSRCFIGAHSVILPGVTIGDQCIVAAGSIVTKDVPSGTLVAGNPARVIKENLRLGPYGRMEDADANEQHCRVANNFFADTIGVEKR